MVTLQGYNHLVGSQRGRQWLKLRMYFGDEDWVGLVNQRLERVR